MVALAAVAYGAYQPHWQVGQEHHRFPTHLDEYYHWGTARSVQRTGLAEGPDGFSASAAELPDMAIADLQIHQRGFHTFLAVLQGVAGLDWLPLLQFFPLGVAMFLSLVVYVLAQRWHAGVASVLWLAAVPSTLRFLGPGYVVPIAFAIPFVFLVIWLLTMDKTRAWPIIGIVLAMLWTVHAMGALLATAITVTYVMSRGRDLRLLLLVAVPLLLAAPFYASDLMGPVLREASLPPEADAIRIAGIPLFAAAALGAAWLASRQGPSTRAAGVALGAAVVTLLALVVLRNMRDWDPYRLYDRAVTTLLPLLALLAGAGVMAVHAALVHVASRWVTRRRLVAVLLVVLLAGEFAFVASATSDAGILPRYHVLSESTYASYSEAAVLLGPAHTALVDGPDTMAWTALTGQPTLYVWDPGAAGPPVEISSFFEAGASDTVFLIENDVSVVVTPQEVRNPDLREIAPRVYLLDIR